MEKACAKEVLERSKDSELACRYMESDGDSKAYGEVYDIYGKCEDCKKDREMDKLNKEADEYVTWKNSSEYKDYIEAHALEEADCHKVQKLDCVGHVQTRMGKALRNQQKEKGKLADDKPVGG